MGRPPLPAGTRTVDRAGYVRVKAPGHPPARDGWVREHQLVLYTRIGPGVHNCHNCGAPVTWGGTLEVDHLDRNRQNNRVDNLAAACRSCQNGNRRFSSRQERMRRS
jgi:5-methylcytosine-specific restriction endonuclease McrA